MRTALLFFLVIIFLEGKQCAQAQLNMLVIVQSVAHQNIDINVTEYELGIRRKSAI